jgi:maleylacetoacetate isomerase
MSGLPRYRLYHYWRSSSSWRVRLALDWKSIPFEPVAVGLLNGESEAPEHLRRNPAGFVPVLEIPGEKNPFLGESLAIIQYLEAVHPECPTLLPGSPLDRARIWALAEVVNAGIQPIQNIPVMERHSSDPGEQKAWARDFIGRGLAVYEKLCRETAGKFSVGDAFSLADACLIPQIYNAQRYEVDLSAFPVLSAVDERCRALAVYESSHPDRYKPVDFKG